MTRDVSTHLDLAQLLKLGPRELVALIATTTWVPVGLQGTAAALGASTISAHTLEVASALSGLVAKASIVCCFLGAVANAATRFAAVEAETLLAALLLGGALAPKSIQLHGIARVLSRGRLLCVLRLLVLVLDLTLLCLARDQSYPT